MLSVATVPIIGGPCGETVSTVHFEGTVSGGGNVIHTQIFTSDVTVVTYTWAELQYNNKCPQFI